METGVFFTPSLLIEVNKEKVNIDNIRTLDAIKGLMASSFVEKNTEGKEMGYCASLTLQSVQKIGELLSKLIECRTPNMKL